MGNSLANLSHCFSAAPIRRRHVAAAVTSEPLDEGLGHSFCYLRPPDPTKVEPAATIFRSISGAALSANPSTALSTSLLYLDDCPSAAAFDCSTSFSSIPLQPLPRFPSGPLSGPLDRAFLSGPIERSFLSGPIDRADLFSAPLEKVPPLAPARRLRRSLSHGGAALRRRLLQGLTNALSRTFPPKPPKELPDSADSGRISTETNGHDNNLQWAQGKAGEDRVHVVVSEEHGWVFVGIYDGFNGPDATDYLLSNLYLAVQRELKGMVWDRTTRAADHHMEVLKALSKALMTTEEAFLDEADKMVAENPELALMGSCVLVMLMKGEDVYLMNVGDSRAVLARRREQDLERIGEESLCDDELLSLGAVQLTLDHSTGVEEEVRRIRNEHSDDASAIANDRVKGSLKVTRAFGAGFLKQPKWNNALLEMFRIDYIGTAPYITCVPSLYHHTLGPRDRFLLLSSDGLYQYFTNEEAVTEVELFIDTTPEGDPAQHLVEEVLFRAAKSAGMDFHELLEIPQGDRRRYHDDVSIIVISLEGRIWSSGV